MPISVLIVDDEAIVRAGLRLILETADDLVVVGEADDGRAALGAVNQLHPNVVLMDLRMPRMDGATATASIRQLDDAPSVVVLTTFDGDEDVFRALEVGATGFLLKDTPPRDLIRAVRAAVTGEAMLSPSITRRLIGRVVREDTVRRRSAQAKLDGLTEREVEILEQVGSGLTNAQIAERLYLSEGTVKTHITHLFEKLDATNRVQLAITAFRAGLVD